MKIFYSFVISLSAMKDGVYDFYPGHKIYSLFLDFIKKTDQQMSKILHDEKSEKSITISSFLGKDVDKPVQIERSKHYFIRVTCLDDAVFETLMDGFLEKNILKEPVKIGNVDFQITEVILDNQLSKWAGHLSVEELIKKDFDSTTVKLRFYTPTLFRSRNEHCRYPIPEKIFSSLLRKFNKYSPQKLDPQIEEKFNKVHIFEKKTKSRRVTMKEFYLEGFIGDVIFQIPQDPELLKAVNVLSEFAFFAGVGYKTTMGLGQTRRVPLNEEEEEL